MCPLLTYIICDFMPTPGPHISIYDFMPSIALHIYIYTVCVRAITVIVLDFLRRLLMSKQNLPEPPNLLYILSTHTYCHLH